MLLKIRKYWKFLDSEFFDAIDALNEAESRKDWLVAALQVAKLYASKTETEADDEFVAKAEQLLNQPGVLDLIANLLDRDDEFLEADFLDTVQAFGANGRDTGIWYGTSVDQFAGRLSKEDSLLDPESEENPVGCDPLTIAIGIMTLAKFIYQIRQERKKRK